MNREWPVLSFWAIPAYTSDFNDVDSGQGFEPRSLSSHMEEARKNRSDRCWTNLHAGAVRMTKKSNGALIVRASLPGVHKDDVKLDLRDQEGESILSLTIEKSEDHQSTDHFGGVFYRRSHFMVKRTIPLGQRVNVGDIKADLEDENLIIEVRLPSSDPNSSCRLDVHDGTRKPISAPQSTYFAKEGKADALGSRGSGFRE